MLAAIRREHAVPMPKVRRAIDYLRENTRDEFDELHPLISKQLQTDGLDLFIEQYERLVNVSSAGQLAMRDIIEAALSRIERDRHGIPIKLYPFTRSYIDNAPTIVVIDPALSAGRPVIAGTGLATEVIAERYKAGETVAELAKDYDRKKAEDRRSDPMRTQSGSLTKSSSFSTVIWANMSLPRRCVKPAISVEIHDDHLPVDAPDEDWIRLIGSRGWIALTKDKTNSISNC